MSNVAGIIVQVCMHIMSIICVPGSVVTFLIAVSSYEVYIQT